MIVIVLVEIYYSPISWWHIKNTGQFTSERPCLTVSDTYIAKWNNLWIWQKKWWSCGQCNIKQLYCILCTWLWSFWSVLIFTFTLSLMISFSYTWNSITQAFDKFDLCLLLKKWSLRQRCYIIVGFRTIESLWYNCFEDKLWRFLYFPPLM